MTQIDNWEKNRFELLKQFQDYWNEEAKYTSQNNLTIDSQWIIVEYVFKQITLAKAEGVKEEHDRWANQTSNQHDEKIRTEERKRIVEIIKEIPMNRKTDIIIDELINKIC